MTFENILIVIRRTIMAICGIAAIGIISQSCLATWKASADFPQYYAVSKMYTANKGPDVYVPERLQAEEKQYFQNTNREVVLFSLPPYTMPYLLWVQLFPPQLAHSVWTILGIAAYAVSVFVLSRAFGLASPLPFWILVISSFLGPVLQALLMSQPAFFMLLGLSAAILALKKNHQVLAAVFLSALFPKPQLLAPIMVYLLGARRYKCAFWAIGLGLAVAGFSLVFPGLATYEAYAKYLKLMNDRPELLYAFCSVSFRTQLLRLLGQHNQIINYLWVAVWGLAMIFLGWFGHKQAKNEKWLEVGLLAALPIGFVTAPYVQPYDLVLWLPSVLIFLFGKLNSGLPKWLRQGSLVVFFLLLFPIYIRIYFSTKPLYGLFFITLYSAVIFAVTAMANGDGTVPAQRGEITPGPASSEP